MKPVVIDAFSDQDARRFWARVSLPDSDGCQLWLGRISNPGYGSFDWNGRQLQASRVALALATGELPADLEAAHSCRNRHCVAPLHLRWATQVENAADRIVDDTHSRGERNAWVRLSTEKVIEIRARYAAGGHNYLTLSEEYGVSPASIRNVVQYRTWAWLPGDAAGPAPLGWAARTHCTNGHEFTPENTHINDKGWRACRACGRARQQRSKAKR